MVIFLVESLLLLVRRVSLLVVTFSWSEKNRISRNKVVTETLAREKLAKGSSRNLVS